jgi:malonyl CoA-acyl carrier protein transacylase
MHRDGITSFCEMGPGKVLQGLVRRTKEGVRISGIDKHADLMAAERT